jgi:phosphoribosylformylglycinamidine synthase
VGGADAGVHAVHDVSAGGLAVALAEMACASGLGAQVELAEAAELFTELPSRLVVATDDPEALCGSAAARGVATAVLGRAGGERLVAGALLDVAVDALRAAYEGNLPAILGDTWRRDPVRE